MTAAPRKPPAKPRVLTLVLARTGDDRRYLLRGDTPGDDRLVRELLPRTTPHVTRSNLDRLIPAAAAARVRLVIRTDCEPME